MDVVARDRRFAGLFLAFIALLEDHFEGDPEQQQAAGDPEGADGNAKQSQNAVSKQRESRQDEEGDQRPAPRHQKPFVPAHADGQAEEDRRKAGRIDGDQDRGQRIDQKVDVRHPVPLAALFMMTV